MKKRVALMAELSPETPWFVHELDANGNEKRRLAAFRNQADAENFASPPKFEFTQWLRSLEQVIVVWEESDKDGRSRIYDLNTCYPGGRDSLVCHVKKPE